MAADDPEHAPLPVEWLHRGLGTEVWVRLRGQPLGDVAPTLALVDADGPGGAPALVAPLTRRAGVDGDVLDGRLDLAVLPGASTSRPARWRAVVHERQTSRTVRAGDERLRFRLADDDAGYVVDVRDEGEGLRVELSPQAPWAEVAHVEVGDESVVLAVRPIGADRELHAEGPWTLVARDPDDDREVTRPGEVDGAHVRVTVDASALSPGTWRLLLRAPDGSELPLGRHLDDVARKDRAVLYPWVPASGPEGPRRLRPVYRRDNELLVELRPGRPAGSGAPGGGPSAGRRRKQAAKKGAVPARKKAAGRRRRWRAVARRDTALTLAVRVALGLAGLAARATRRVWRRSLRDTGTVHLVHLNAYAMGGTVRTVWNLADALARHSDVRVVSVLRERQEPYLGAENRVRLLALDDRREEAVRPGGLRGRVRAALARRPSMLVPPSENRQDRFSLLTDVLLVALMWRLPRGILVMSRPALNLVAAGHAPGWLTVVGQEHLTLTAHPDALNDVLLAQYPRLDALTVLTRADAQDWRDHLATDRPLVRQIPNAVPDVPFPRSTGEAKVVVAAGRLAGAKKFHVLIRAFARVAAAHPDWTLRIYGGGDQQPRLERAIRNQGLAEHVHLMGRTQRIWQEMAKGSIFALSSSFEGFGMVLIEAFQCGLPVVSFDAPRGPREIVQHEVNGLLVPEQDGEALADALIRMIEDDELRARCAAGALASGEAYAMSAVEQQWRRLFQEAVTRPRPGPLRGALRT